MKSISPKYLFENYKFAFQLFKIVEPKFKIKTTKLLCVMTLSSLSEMLTIGALVPLIGSIVALNESDQHIKIPKINLALDSHGLSVMTFFFVFLVLISATLKK